MDRLEQLLKLIEASPEDLLTHYAAALELADRERFDEALAAFDKSLALDENYSAAYYHKARVEIRAGRREDAKRTLQIGVECARKRGDQKTEREMQELLLTAG